MPSDAGSVNLTRGGGMVCAAICSLDRRARGCVEVTAEGGLDRLLVVYDADRLLAQALSRFMIAAGVEDRQGRSAA